MCLTPDFQLHPKYRVFAFRYRAPVGETIPGPTTTHSCWPCKMMIFKLKDEEPLMSPLISRTQLYLLPRGQTCPKNMQLLVFRRGWQYKIYNRVNHQLVGLKLVTILAIFVCPITISNCLLNLNILLACLYDDSFWWIWASIFTPHIFILTHSFLTYFE